MMNYDEDSLMTSFLWYIVLGILLIRDGWVDKLGKNWIGGISEKAILLYIIHECQPH